MYVGVFSCMQVCFHAYMRTWETSELYKLRCLRESIQKQRRHLFLCKKLNFKCFKREFIIEKIYLFINLNCVKYMNDPSFLVVGGLIAAAISGGRGFSTFSSKYVRQMGLIKHLRRGIRTGVCARKELCTGHLRIRERQSLEVLGFKHRFFSPI